MNTAPDLATCLYAWFNEVRQAGISIESGAALVNAMSRFPAWASVRAAVQATVPLTVRPDLYTSEGELRDATLLGMTGLARAAQAITNGLPVNDQCCPRSYQHSDDLQVGTAVAEFVTFCQSPLPMPEDWLLLDAQIPKGTLVSVGGYSLKSATAEDLRQLLALPTARAVCDVLERSEMDPKLLDGAAFLCRDDPEGELVHGLRWPLMDLPTRPELHHWRPLFILLLWRSDVACHMDAWFVVERGRRIDRRSGAVPWTMDIFVNEQGEEVEVERRQRGLYEVSQEEMPRFLTFCNAVDSLIDIVLADTTKAGKKRARRLERAAKHLVRASHRTHIDGSIWEEEADEITLQYVIAMEALLTGNGNSGVAQKIKQRAAMLWMTDETRERVLDMVSTSYDSRSKYAHGDDTREDVQHLHDLRKLATNVTLRWLITAAAAGPDLGKRLDTALTSDAVRQNVVTDPLTVFFTRTPPRQAPPDLAP
ncbi:HEPN domain-containing protein [Streptomyces torulosus]|uniref:HEPN domain-containing protein n=1 Tax=Streptomyces torulosus TaxID=68276 RepID=UPI000AFB050B|nr:HEPN domain-containing protein [Streptomyces torulosus]